MNTVLECESLTKSYGDGEIAERVLEKVSLSFRPGEACLLLGPSGSGKTTLLSIFGCLLTPTSGSLRIAGKPVDFSSPRALEDLRRTQLGFVFQQARMLSFLTVEENLSVVGCNAGMQPHEVGARITVLFDRLGLNAVRRKEPGKVSGGQRQRVAIARALLHRPPIVLADEPTAALDRQNGETVAELLVEQSRETGAMLIVVTHDTRLLPHFDRVMEIENGQVRERTARRSDVK